MLDINSGVNGLPTEPGFHPEARYEIKIHVDRAEFENLTYRVAFAEPDADGRQRLTLRSLTGDQARGDAGVGDLVLEGRTGETATDGYGVRLWAGHVKDSSYVDLSLLGIVNGAVANGTAVDLPAWRPDQAQNSFAGSTVRTIVLEIPHDDETVSVPDPGLTAGPGRPAQPGPPAGPDPPRNGADDTPPRVSSAPCRYGPWPVTGGCSTAAR